MDAPDRRDDVWSRERITQVLQSSIEDRRHLNEHLKWVERAVAVFGVVLVASVALITGVPGVSSGLIGANKDRVEEIQAERTSNILRLCQDQNKRHDDTVTNLDSLLALAKVKYANNPAKLEQIRESRASTISLIDALAPKNDCAAILRQQVPSGKG